MTGSGARLASEPPDGAKLEEVTRYNPASRRWRIAECGGGGTQPKALARSEVREEAGGHGLKRARKLQIGSSHLEETRATL